MADNKSFNIDPAGQEAVLGWMLKDKQFAFNCKIHLKKEMFVDKPAGDIFEKMIEFLEEYKTPPSNENLAALFYRQADYERYKKKIYSCEAQTLMFPLDFLSKEIDSWIKLCIYKGSLQQAIDAFHKADDPRIKSVFDVTLSKILNVQFRGKPEYQFGDAVQDFKKDKVLKEKAVVSGLPELDNLVGGGFFCGAHTVLIAPSNTGKTTVCLNFLYHNTMAKKHCLFITHEMTPALVVSKLRQRFLYKTTEECDEFYSNPSPENQEIIDKIENRLKEYLTYIPYNKAGGMYVEDVVDLIRQKNIELYNKIGKYYDLIIDDYPMKLESKNFGNAKEIRFSLKYIYEQFHQLALEFNCHAISPAQANRTGSRANREREDESNFLGMEDIGECFGIAQDADNAITLNRSDLDNDNELLTFYNAKNRNTKKGNFLTVKTDYTRIVTHDKRLQDAFQQQKVKSALNRINEGKKVTAEGTKSTADLLST